MESLKILIKLNNWKMTLNVLKLRGNELESPKRHQQFGMVVGPFLSSKHSTPRKFEFTIIEDSVISPLDLTYNFVIFHVSYEYLCSMIVSSKNYFQEIAWIHHVSSKKANQNTKSYSYIKVGFHSNFNNTYYIDLFGIHIFVRHIGIMIPICRTIRCIPNTWVNFENSP